MMLLSIASKVIRSIDNGHDCIYHCLVAAHFMFQRRSNGQSISKHKVVRVSKQQLADPVSRARFIQSLARIPSPSWHFPLDSHDVVLQCGIQRAIRSAFPCPPLRRIKPLSCSLWLPVVSN